MQLYCEKCKKTLDEKNFYTYRNGTKCELCKPCLTMHINNWEEDTYLWILEKFDVPYVPAEWNSLRDKAYVKDPYKMNGMSVLGKYLSKMKLKQWQKYTWADTEALQKEAEEKAELYKNENSLNEQQMEEMREAFERGEISEAQWKTYQQINQPTPTFDFGGEGNVDSPSSQPIPASKRESITNSYLNNSPYEQVDLPDVGSDLTAEDKLYLATKWGQFYTASDWVYLEKKYEDFMNSFDIQGAARIDTLIQICKLSLKLNQALDSGDMDAYSKLVRAYDALMKSAKFTEAQKKEEKKEDFDAVGQIVFFAEKEGGKIPRYKIDTPLDIVDKAIVDLKKYTHDLVVNDSTLSQMLENLIKRRENAAMMKEEREKAEAEGLDVVQIKDEDYKNFSDFLAEDNGEEDEE